MAAKPPNTSIAAKKSSGLSAKNPPTGRGSGNPKSSTGAKAPPPWSGGGPWGGSKWSPAGVKAAGAIAKAAAAKTAATKATPATAPAGGTPSGTPAPFLTPAQAANLNSAMLKFESGINADTTRLGTATANTNTALNTAQLTHDVNTDRTNQADAARGMFQSSIRDGDLNDLNVTLTNRQNVLNTALNSLALTTNQDIANLTSQWGITQNLYNGYAVDNAGAMTPTVPTGAPTTSSGAPSPAAVPAAGSTTGPANHYVGTVPAPHPAGPANHPVTSTGTPWAGLHAWSAAPKAPSAPSAGRAVTPTGGRGTSSGGG